MCGIQSEHAENETELIESKQWRMFEVRAKKTAFTANNNKR